MLMPVQATVQGVLGGQLAFGIDIAAVDADHGGTHNPVPSAAAWSLIMVVRTSASTPRSAATRSTSANATGKFGQCSTYSTSTARPGRLSSTSDGMSAPLPAPNTVADQSRALEQPSNRRPSRGLSHTSGRTPHGCRGARQPADDPARGQATTAACQTLRHKQRGSQIPQQLSSNTQRPVQFGRGRVWAPSASVT
jgi:hypothetical protein